MYYPDLSLYEFLSDPRSQGALNVGWLDIGHPFTTGTVTEEALQKILKLCMLPVNQTRGFHDCQFCGKCGEMGVEIKSIHGTIALGSAEIRVKASDKTYAAPNLIYHYIKDHQYLPPNEFLVALENAVVDDSLNQNIPGGIIPAGRFFELATDDYCIAPNLEPHPPLGVFREAIAKIEQQGARVFCEVADIDDGAAICDALLIATDQPIDAFNEFAAEFGADGAQAGDGQSRKLMECLGRPNVWRIPWD